MNDLSKNLPSVTAIIPAAGNGSRLQADFPKQYLRIGRHSILEHAINALLRHPCIQKVIVIIGSEDQKFKRLPTISDPRVNVSIGGKNRIDSVLAGLKLVLSGEWILIHDAARPCLHPDDLSRLLAIMEHSKVGGILAAPVRDTIKRARPGQSTIDHTLERKDLWHALTPQLFPIRLLRDCLKRTVERGIAFTDEASALEYCGYRPLLVKGRSDNIKITWPEDLAIATFYLTKLNP